MDQAEPGTKDVFVSYASEDREEVARPLVELLQSDGGLSVWYDEIEIKPGDSIQAKMDEGLARSRLGVVILSEIYFSKHFTKRELRGLIQRESVGGKIIPVCHRISAERVREFSPPLADLKAIDTGVGIAEVAARIVEVARGECQDGPERPDDYPSITFASVRMPNSLVAEFGRMDRISKTLKGW